MILCFSRYYCIVTTRVIIAFINSSLYSYVKYRQVKEMDNLNLFIDSHYKYIVSIIRVKHILTLHLSTANWRILPTTGCCCKNVAASPLHMLCNIFLPGRVNTTVPRVVAYFNALWWNSNFTLLYRNATTYGITVRIWTTFCVFYTSSNCLIWNSMIHLRSWQDLCNIFRYLN